jgi:membrane fusion protein (multidrug efflux system)
LAPLLLLLALAACSGGQGAAGGQGSQGGQGNKSGGGAKGPLAVVTATVTARETSDSVEALGTARAAEAVDLTPKTANLVTAIHFREGARVARGAVLVEMDSAQVRADLAAAEAAQAESRSQFRRSRELATAKVLSAAQLEQIEATLKANEARVASARARLEDTIIRAPFAGRTGLRRVSLGALVTPGMVITTLDDTSSLRLDFTLPEALLGAVNAGLAVEAGSIAWPGRIFRAKVESVDSRVDPVTRSFTVRARLANTDDALKPGMLLTLHLSGPSAAALIIPEQALVPEQGELYVYVVKGAKAEKRRITLRGRLPGEVVVGSGLTAGEKIVTEGTLRLRPGASVRETPAPVR